ncbi:FGGY family carbohydrate kinase [Paractinoplanes durhamensis]|uniref:FGGY family carbohydrate kinase n=1 Tax=Paractinoplanes durhamensis TaxID=113563 RepID=UPI00363BCE56
MAEQLVLAIDQGTSATKCLLVDAAGAVVREASAPVPIRYPRPGWVEQDAGEILDSVLAAAAQCLDGVPRGAVRAVGFSTQRESAVVWDRHTGLPAGPVLGWQDQRAVGICEDLRAKGNAAAVRAISGLPLDPMFSAAKLRWLLDPSSGPDGGGGRGDGGRGDAWIAAASGRGDLPGRGRLAVGTVDSWLLFALTGSHQIEVGNASRTQLLDVRAGRWSDELLDLFGIPSSVLPEITPSSGELGTIGQRGGALAGLPVTAVLGDSHAALYAHGAGDGDVKATYGTGSSVMRLGEVDGDAVCLTVAWNDKLAAEGNIRSSGATVAWLAAFLGTTPEQIAKMALSAASDGVHLVPAFGVWPHPGGTTPRSA